VGRVWLESRYLPYLPYPPYLRKSATVLLPRTLFNELPRVEETSERSDATGGHTELTGVLADRLRVRRQVHAIQPVVGDVAVQPLHLRPERFQDLQRSQRDVPDSSSDIPPTPGMSRSITN
jgi:hypothetical protein